MKIRLKFLVLFVFFSFVFCLSFTGCSSDDDLSSGTDPSDSSDNDNDSDSDSSGKPISSYYPTGGESGLNYDSDKSATQVRLAKANSKIYAIWQEVYSDEFLHIRVAVYEEDGEWDFVTGGSVGINVDSDKLAQKPDILSLDSTLYATWIELDGDDSYQIRVAEYNGDDTFPKWTMIDSEAEDADGNSIDGTGGLNRYSTISMISGLDAFEPRLFTFDSKLHVTWSEEVSTEGGSHRVYVYSYDSESEVWLNISNNATDDYKGFNVDSSKDARYPSGVEFNSKLYLTWTEEGSDDVDLLQVAVYGGDDSSPGWTLLDGNSGSKGLNYSNSHSASDPQMHEFSNKLYLTWTENTQVRVAVFNGDDNDPAWSYIENQSAGSGLTYEEDEYAIYPTLIGHSGYLYLFVVGGVANA